MFYERVLMFSSIERLCINCLRLIYIILLVNSTKKFVIQTLNVLFERVSCGAWPGAGRVCLRLSSRMLRASIHDPWLRALEAEPTQIQSSSIFPSVFNKIYL